MTELSVEVVEEAEGAGDTPLVTRSQGPLEVKAPAPRAPTGVQCTQVVVVVAVARQVVPIHLEEHVPPLQRVQGVQSFPTV